MLLLNFALVGMPDVLGMIRPNCILGNIGRMIAYPFKGSRDQNDIQIGFNLVGISHNPFHDLIAY